MSNITGTTLPDTPLIVRGDLNPSDACPDQVQTGGVLSPTIDSLGYSPYTHYSFMARMAGSRPCAVSYNVLVEAFLCKAPAVLG